MNYTLFFVLANLFLFVSYFYLDCITPEFQYDKNFKVPDTDWLTHNYFLFEKSYKKNSPYAYECKELYDNLYEMTVKYNKSNLEHSNLSSNNSTSISLCYFLAYIIIVAFWLINRARYLQWWEVAVVAVFVILLKVISYFILQHFSEYFQKHNKHYSNLSYFEYELNPETNNLVSPKAFTDFKSYLEAEYNRSYPVMSRRLSWFIDFEKYYNFSLDFSQAKFFCIISICFCLLSAFF